MQPSRPRIFYGWVIVAASFLVMFCTIGIVNNCAGLFIKPVCDDMGFSDLGCYGSEIQTPNINNLAENGVRFSLFKNTGRDLFFEHQSSCAIISYHWKLLRGSRNEPWELIELSTDPFETKDLSAQYPKLVKKLEIKWNKWAERSNVFPLENKRWSERIRYYIERNPEQNGKE